MDKSKKLHFVCISDTHGLTADLKVPPGDVLIHAGDFSNCGEEDVVAEFNDWLGKLPHKTKIVISGNHEVAFDAENLPKIIKKYYKGAEIDSKKVRSLLTNCIYLEDSSVIVNGYKIYGSPWGWYSHGSGFSVDTPDDLKGVWSKIPDDTDILVTHTPPYGVLDRSMIGRRAGDKELMKVVKERVRPICHVFGHIHEGHGIVQQDGITFINAAICTPNYYPDNPPLQFCLPEKKAT